MSGVVEKNSQIVFAETLDAERFRVEKVERESVGDAAQVKRRVEKLQ